VLAHLTEQDFDGVPDLQIPPGHKKKILLKGIATTTLKNKIVNKTNNSLIV
jgi:hypothetical protein